MELPDGVIGGYIVGQLIRRLIRAGRGPTYRALAPATTWTPPATAVTCGACGARITTAYRFCGHCGTPRNGARR